MTGLDRTRPVAVVGTGTMGQGIAQVALVAGHPVRLHDAVPGRAEQAAAAITARLGRLVEKGRLSEDDRRAAQARLKPAGTLAELADCGLVVEAVLEQLDVKQALFRELEAILPVDCLLATNTSSLSVTAIAGGLESPGRFVGLHFFNPAPLLPLVEVVSGFATEESAATRAYDTAKAWGKSPVRCADTPGFIVNRVARPFYAEALRLYEERVADPATVDAVLRDSGGFKMGPFELTDLIGQDVNEAVTRSVWESFFQDPRFTPSLAQRRLVESGRLGRKSGHGWYAYAEGAVRPEPALEEPVSAPAEVTVHGDLGPAEPLVGLLKEAGVGVRREASESAFFGLPCGARLFSATEGRMAGSHGDAVQFDLARDYGTASLIAVAPSATASEAALREATGLFQVLGKQVVVIADVPGLIVARTVAMLFDVALDALDRGVAGGDDIDAAMRLGVNYPEGPLSWGEGVGLQRLHDLLSRMHDQQPTGRYAPSLGLRRRVHAQEETVRR
ncbi:3-hydroxyacyl-CoA dehydrogenase [Streptomyces sp. B-S-A8]|uniref:3-hydroxyacyl-CoA dehydrogenase n=1 Tax=Streptomyces solicavernae TaxID=3043614 RepID=A0ABT6RK21_9ACTN|nr:3-hydroxyacyl-CoA dehydrogenase [Streptomyces sp. B-S-A8]MDI3384778.1 3-hydroxyacyl-CoA dehydrogenase [Streptomyces sp. B-S-A8]